MGQMNRISGTQAGEENREKSPLSIRARRALFFSNFPGIVHQGCAPTSGLIRFRFRETTGQFSGRSPPTTCGDDEGGDCGVDEREGLRRRRRKGGG
jgi:hypothetical protein